ncbi:sugar phosphate isomerase/epimerase family protein [Aspergillus clavatus NRRL 1]|uniref:4-hydroxyphenylpyruvate dioxygenase, putative n=1 Tax=Aspergillus clavatus (strain ATCC 1007 / CBS 513.65 / DSM 816 / NCTC 3887 / NRRL 1 / QM 1276 / 107) TaxID=344612 RepID=A1CPX2_ASPCL|nr:4-hydroxyphenylpyruvate dioxygenase, putative [Aspergillus clavatus NRRL 1]EAW07693.1 4-hydroxyphenylpyruvate dioxygenase, putative [Aspergillus clavatus NRRL 1]
MPNRLGIGSMSLGRPGIHDLPGKLHQASRYGYEGIELFIDDLDHLARTDFDGCNIAAAHEVRRLCDALHLSIICLQPFGFYEGLLDRSQHEYLVTQKLPHWFRLAHILNTDLIQIPSNFLPPDPTTHLPRTTGDPALIVADLQRVADLGAAQSPPLRFVYEALAWGNHIDTWEACYAVVERVNRPNFGICLDSFNLAGRVFADPASPTGTTPTAHADLRASLARLRSTVDVAKVFYLQLVDAERLAAPLDTRHPFHVPGQPPRMSWSRNARLFPFEEHRGGYLPVVDVARAFFDLGFEGWVSLELFSRTLADPDPSVPEAHARRGYESWRKMVEVLELEGPAPPRALLEGSEVASELKSSKSSAAVALEVQHRL